MRLPTNWYLTEVGDFFGTIWFRREFRVPAELRGQRLFLRFGAVDYLADVWLNGTYLGSHEGMFNPFEFDVTDLLDLEGTNVIVVKDGAPRDDTEYIQVDFSDNPLSTPYRTHQAKAITQIKGHMIDAMHRPGSQTSFRSDGNTGGIWDSVGLVARPSVSIDHVKVFTKIGIKKDWLGDKTDRPDGTALVALDVTVLNTTGRAVETDLGLSVAPRSFEGPEPVARSRRVVLKPGRSTHKIVLTVPEARLWWTWDRGLPNLYTATVTVDDDRVDQPFGVKELVHDEPTGQWYLNGERLFLRGMRYISSLWMSEANEAMWSEDLAKMLDMQINSIRIGSHVEKDGFYTMCDEIGFLIWQVFPLLLRERQRQPHRARERPDPRHGPHALQPREPRHVVGLQGARGLPASRQAEQLPPSVPDPEGDPRHGGPGALDPSRRLSRGRAEPDDRLLLGRRHPPGRGRPPAEHRRVRGRFDPGPRDARDLRHAGQALASRLGHLGVQRLLLQPRLQLREGRDEGHAG
jgi:hypothetical protein